MQVTLPASITHYYGPSGAIYANTGAAVTMTPTDAAAAMQLGATPADAQASVEQVGIIAQDGTAGILGDETALAGTQTNTTFTE